MKPAVHRFTATSKRGRQIAAANSRIEQGPGLSPEQQEHNARIEAERQQRLQRRKERRGQS